MDTITVRYIWSTLFHTPMFAWLLARCPSFDGVVLPVFVWLLAKGPSSDGN